MRVHFIAIGGAAMHNLAISLHEKGYQVSGSDDEIFEPSRSRLEKKGLLPKTFGWDPNRIDSEIDAIVLGMHAREDNPELLEANKIGIKVYSYPEYLYEATRDKIRVVIGGSHGKTTITSMVMHVLKLQGIEFDYMVGAQVEGFETMVHLSNNSKYAVFEGDEYLASALDPRPKFHLYHPHIAVISGIAWDHINVFKTFDIYKEQFYQFIQLIEPAGTLVYCADDKNVTEIANQVNSSINKLPYSSHPFKDQSNQSFLIVGDIEIPIQVFGQHNMQNISAAKAVCNLMEITDKEFYTAIGSFKGAAKRLQLLAETENRKVYLDFAHSPSKLKATIQAVKDKYSSDKLIAVMELHTYSSLNSEFLAEYRGCMELADYAIVYFSPHALELKKLNELKKEDVAHFFNIETNQVYTQPDQLKEIIRKLYCDNAVLLLMTSGNFDGLDLKQLAVELISS